MISPTTLQNLKPWPEKPVAIVTWGCVGWRSRMKCVRREREETGLHGHRRTVGVGEVSADGDAQHLFVFGMALAVDRIRVAALETMVVFADLEPGTGSGNP